MLTHGHLYEDPHHFREQLFKTRFNKCSGLISYRSNSNDREVYKFEIRNARNVDGQIKFVVAGSYWPICTTVFVYHDGGIIWPDLTQNVPSDTIPTETWSFYSDDTASYFISLVIYGVLLLITVWISWVLIKRKVYPPPAKLKEQVKIEINDFIQLASIFFEML
jgi:hypothetical protein